MFYCVDLIFENFQLKIYKEFCKILDNDDEKSRKNTNIAKIYDYIDEKEITWDLSRFIFLIKLKSVYLSLYYEEGKEIVIG